MNKSPKSVVERFWTKVSPEPNTGCWLWTGRCRDDGYGIFPFKSRVDQARAHRIAWELTNGPIPEGLFVCHRCDNPPCCNPDHLFLGTAADNNQDAAAKGRNARHTRPWTTARGERNGNSKLSPAVVAEIRAMVNGGADTESTGRRFSVNRATINRIVSRKTWGHVT